MKCYRVKGYRVLGLVDSFEGRDTGITLTREKVISACGLRVWGRMVAEFLYHLPLDAQSLQS